MHIMYLYRQCANLEYEYSVILAILSQLGRDASICRPNYPSVDLFMLYSQHPAPYKSYISTKNLTLDCSICLFIILFREVNNNTYLV